MTDTASGWPSIPALVRDAADRHGSREALVDGAVRLGYGELRAEVDRAARAVVAAGVEPGDRVALWAPNVWEWLPTVLGLQSAGASVVPLNTRFKGAEAGDILARSRARVLVTIAGFLDTDYVALLRSACGDEGGGRPVSGLPDLERVVVLRGDAPAGTERWDAFLAAGDQVSLAEVDRRVAALGPEDPSDVLFTSGTTGRPKGVVCTHGQTLRGFAEWASVVGLAETDRYLVVNPFFHAFGYKAGIVASLVAGATLVPMATFDIDALLGVIVAERITMLPGPPTIYQSLLAHPSLGSADLSSLRLAVTGAASVPVELVERMRSELGFDTVITGYGLTESSGIATMCRHDDDDETVATTSGRAIGGTEVRVVDDAGVEAARGEPGEVVVRGYNVMAGYFEDPERTAEVLDPDGWLHTGDIGVMDERGYLAITDRKKDLFITGGFNVYPAEVERLLLGHPAVAQAAVVGAPDERLGEVGVAFVVLRSDQEVEPEEVAGWARREMANFKVPRRVVVVDALPLNAGGKVLKGELRARAGTNESAEAV